MDYRETLDFLYSSLPFYQRVGAAAYKSGLENTIILDNHFKNPHKRFKTIHIAGTNGKGSVSHMLASVMAEAGMKCGLYTSPHLRDFTERIKVNGTPVGEDWVVAFVAENKEILKRVKPSFFEMTVAMAFDYFSRSDVDIAIIETGMGGRLDSTNIITPLLSVITNIALDHTAFLGPDRVAIAGEKAGIIKPGVPVVIGESDPDTDPLFIRVAGDKGAPLYFADRQFRAVVEATADPLQPSLLSVSKGNIVSQGNIVSHGNIVSQGNTVSQGNIVSQGNRLAIDSIPFPLHGKYQEKNVQTVMQVLEIVGTGLNIQPSTISQGVTNVIVNTSLEGRWQVLRKDPLVILDTAHNESGLRSTIGQLKSIHGRGRLRFVVGFVNDKDVGSLLKLFPSDAAYYFTRSSVPRSMHEDEIAAFAAEAGISGHTFGSVASAYLEALKESSDRDIIYVGGSTFVVADLLIFQERLR